jgi:N-acetylmuramoyl-L-alanine amidase
MWLCSAGLAIVVAAALAAAGSARAAPAPASDAPVVASAARLGGDMHQTRIVIDLTRPVTPTVFTLADPARVIIDLPGVVFRAPPPGEGRGLVGVYRYGLMSRDRSRVVIEAKEPVEVEKTYTVAAVGSEPARLVVTLAPTSRARFLKNIAAHRPPELAPSTPPPAVADSRDSRPLIVLDPGHGGIDPGTHGEGGVQEKNVVLAFAKVLAAKLRESGRYRVLMTRNDDTYVPLGDRTEFARSRQARLFISLHADSLSWPYHDDLTVRGATVYTLSSKASDAEAARLADQENRSDVIAGVDLTREPDAVAGILIDLTRRETHVFSMRFSRDLLHNVKHVMPLNKRPQRSAGFVVLKAPDVPSVLVELGYMTSPDDLAHLTSATWRGKAAAAMVRAVNEFFGPRVVAGATSSVN